jgi:hypothetical protein
VFSYDFRLRWGSESVQFYRLRLHLKIPSDSDSIALVSRLRMSDILSLPYETLLLLIIGSCAYFYETTTG